MKHDSMISFRLSHDLRDRLRKVADRRDETLSAVIKDILETYLEREEQESERWERRRHPRRELELPAIIQVRTGDEIHTRSGKLENLSEGGLKMVFPADRIDVDIFIGANNLFDVLFQIPELDEAVFINCRAARVSASPAVVELGAQFDNGRAGERKALMALLS